MAKDISRRDNEMHSEILCLKISKDTGFGGRLELNYVVQVHYLDKIARLIPRP